MGAFTSLGDPELREIAEAFELGAVHRLRPIAAGTINSNFALTTDRGAFFLRVNEHKTEGDVAWEARLVTALAAAGVATPPPLVARDGRSYAQVAGLPKFISVFPWRAGTHLAATEVTPTIAARFGAALAALHRAGQALPSGWQRASIYDHDHLVARFERLVQTSEPGEAASAGERRLWKIDDPVLAPAVAIVGDELAVAAAAVETRRAATHGIIHGDLFRDNVLWEDGEITAILDFEQASSGSLAYDLAVAINDWCWTSAPRIDLAAALVAGYHAVRPLTGADRAALPIEIRAAAARFTLTRITDVYLARVDNPDKDFRAFLARCEAWRGPALGQLTGAV